MPPQARPESIHSWWSNSNKPGATIALHPIASRVAKLLHHRRINAVLKSYKFRPLPAEVVYDIVPYLESKDISSATKVKTLSTILRNNETVLVRTCVDANCVVTLVYLLQTGNHKVLQAAYSLLMCLVTSHRGDGESLFNTQICSSLVELLRHGEPEVQKKTLHILTEISDRDEIEKSCGAYTDALPTLVVLLLSSDADILKWACRIMGNLALQKTVAPAVIDADPCLPLISLLSHESLRFESLRTLHRISAFSELGALVVAYANVVPPLSVLLESCEDSSVLKLTCTVLNDLALHKNLRETVSGRYPCLPLILLLRRREADVQLVAAHALERISRSFIGAHTIYLLDGYTIISGLLQLTNQELVVFAFQTLCNIIQADTHALESVGCADLVKLLSHPEGVIQRVALTALGPLSEKREGASALLDAGAIPCLLNYGYSTDIGILEDTCVILSNIIAKTKTSFKQVASFPFDRLLRYREPVVFVSALNLLSDALGLGLGQITMGNLSITRGNLTSLSALVQREFLQDSLDDSSLTRACRVACQILGRFVGRDELDVEEAIRVSGCMGLVSILRNSSLVLSLLLPKQSLSVLSPPSVYAAPQIATSPVTPAPPVTPTNLNSPSLLPVLGNILQPGDVVGEGIEFRGEPIRIVSLLSQNPRHEMATAQKFEVVRQLGTGSYAVVYLVLEVLERWPLSEGGHSSITGSMGTHIRSPSTTYGHEYGLKYISKANLDVEALDAQMDEVTFHQSLYSHPNIVTLHRAFETSSFLLLLMEYVPGEDLFYFLQQACDYCESSRTLESTNSTSWRTPPTPSLLLNSSQLFSRTRLGLISSMFSQMCDAVAACHAQQVFHRDIKPENFVVIDVFTDNGGRHERKVIVKLTDFGLSTTDVESFDMDVGSAPYMSYECRNNVAPSYRPRAADVWSLGIVLINMLYHLNPWMDTKQDACNSFSLFRQQPVDFFMQRFVGMTLPVAEFLAYKVFNVLDDLNDDSKRISAAEFGIWSKSIPDLLGLSSPPLTHGHLVQSSIPISHHLSRQASKRLYASAPALFHISSSETGARSVMNAQALPVLVQLLESSVPQAILKVISEILGNISMYQNLPRTLINADDASMVAFLLSTAARTLCIMNDTSELDLSAIVDPNRVPNFVEMLRSLSEPGFLRPALRIRDS